MIHVLGLEMEGIKGWAGVWVKSFILCKREGNGWV